MLHCAVQGLKGPEPGRHCPGSGLEPSPRESWAVPNAGTHPCPGSPAPKGKPWEPRVCLKEAARAWSPSCWKGLGRRRCPAGRSGEVPRVEARKVLRAEEGGSSLRYPGCHGKANKRPA